jgi:hypothetical protein
MTTTRDVYTDTLGHLCQVRGSHEDHGCVRVTLPYGLWFLDRRARSKVEVQESDGRPRRWDAE